MARIRTIKPDFWTDEKITECSVSARLFFIGCWNFADDNGNLQRSAKKLKMQIFPADAIDCEPLLQELMTHGLLSEYSVSGDLFMHIKGFTKHQVINRPSKTGLPLHTFIEGSVSTPEVISDDSGTEGKGKEGKGKEQTTSTDVDDEIGGADLPSLTKIANCPQQKIIDLYAKHLPTLPYPRVWEGERQKSMRTRWRWVLTATKRDGTRYAVDEESAMDWFDRFFEFVSHSEFLTGRSGKWTSCDLGWLMKAENFAKVIQGNYENKEAA